MTYTLPYKTKQFFFVLLKISLVVLAFYYIYQKLMHNDALHISIFIDFLSKNNVLSPKTLVFLLILTIFNWLFEILKWQVLVHPVQKLSFKMAIEQSLGSLTASLFTPNRIGEYGAKAIYFSKILRKRVMLIIALGNIMQMSITLLLGVIGFYFFTEKHLTETIYHNLFQYLLIGLILITACFILLLKSPIKIKGFSLRKIKKFILLYPKNNYLLGFSLSLLRYAFFSFQFYYLLLLFGIDITYINAMIVVTSMYLLSSIIPSIVVFDVIVKGSIAVSLFAIIGINELTILCTVMLMWLMNFVLPSIFGSYYVLNFNVSKENHLL